MDQDACVKCHNTHIDRTWPEHKWRLGDKRGVLEVITPIDKPLEANKKMKNDVIIIISISTLILVFVYSFFLVRREKELTDVNEVLDQKVKEEVEKNLQKEKQLTIQSRSAAMGDMLAAIIHQWKQPLNSISISNSNLELQASMDNIDKKDILNSTKHIKQQINNMTTTMNDFRNFFKPQNIVEYDINVCIKDVLNLIEKIYQSNNIKIELDLLSNLKTYGYPNELSQVIINILNNAKDAIKENDSKIRTIFIKTSKEEKYNIITIRDCAGGIPEDIIDKVFNPYFTTKEDDKGTGIGLDMSKSIIEKVHGNLSVKNSIISIDEVDYIGAEFIIMLPIDFNDTNDTNDKNN